MTTSNLPEPLAITIEVVEAVARNEAINVVYSIILRALVSLIVGVGIGLACVSAYWFGRIQEQQKATDAIIKRTDAIINRTARPTPPEPYPFWLPLNDRKI